MFVIITYTYLIPAKVVDEYHANEDDQQAETLEGEHGHAKSAVLSRHTRRVVFAEGAALLTRQAVAGRTLVCIGTAVCSFAFPPHLCRKNMMKKYSLISDI